MFWLEKRSSHILILGYSRVKERCRQVSQSLCFNALIGFEHIIHEATVSNSTAPVRRRYARYRVQSRSSAKTSQAEDFRLLTAHTTYLTKVDNAKITVSPEQCQSSGARGKAHASRCSCLSLKIEILYTHYDYFAEKVQTQYRAKTVKGIFHCSCNTAYVRTVKKSPSHPQSSPPRFPDQPAL